jgi:hypothetical protein
LAVPPLLGKTVETYFSYIKGHSEMGARFSSNSPGNRRRSVRNTSLTSVWTFLPVVEFYLKLDYTMDNVVYSRAQYLRRLDQ